MKDKIYTIPVNEAFDEHSECGICTLEKKLEDEAVEYVLGAAMMEPGFRVMSNDKGYCNKHFGLLFKKQSKLSLALMLDTHVEELRKKFDAVSKAAKTSAEKKSSIFKREKNDLVAEALEAFEPSLRSCVICEKLEQTMERYIRVFFGLWKDEEEFRKKVEASMGFCLEHFAMLLRGAKKHLDNQRYKQFCKFLCEKEEEELERVGTDVHNFTLKFNYINHSKPWGTEKDGPVRGIEKISGYIIRDNK